MMTHPTPALDCWQQLTRLGAPCLLCGRHAAGVVSFVPAGPSPERRLAIFYAYCGCAGPNTATLAPVVRAFLRHFAPQCDPDGA